MGRTNPKQDLFQTLDFGIDMRDTPHEMITDFNLGTRSTRSGRSYQACPENPSARKPRKPRRPYKTLGDEPAVNSGGEVSSEGAKEGTGANSTNAAAGTTTRISDTGVPALPAVVLGGDHKEDDTPNSPLSAAMSQWEHISLQKVGKVLEDANADDVETSMSIRSDSPLSTTGSEYGIEDEVSILSTSTRDPVSDNRNEDNDHGDMMSVCSSSRLPSLFSHNLDELEADGATDSGATVNNDTASPLLGYYADPPDHGDAPNGPLPANCSTCGGKCTVDPSVFLRDSPLSPIETPVGSDTESPPASPVLEATEYIGHQHERENYNGEPGSPDSFGTINDSRDGSDNIMIGHFHDGLMGISAVSLSGSCW